MKKKIQRDCWALLAPRVKKGKQPREQRAIWKFLFSKEGAIKNMGYYGKDRVRKVTITYHD